MYDPLKMKYWPRYMAIAEAAAIASVSRVSKVGAALVLPSGMISIGWNGTQPGDDNCCEDVTKLKQDELTGEYRHPTDHSRVIHAEMNVLKKLKDQGISASGGILFTTLSPCEKCCIELQNTGIRSVVYRTAYKDKACLDILHAVGISTAWV